MMLKKSEQELKRNEGGKVIGLQKRVILGFSLLISLGIFSALVYAATVPSAPTLTGIVQEGGNIKLTWTAPSNNGGSPLTRYIVWRDSPSAAYNVWAPATTTSLPVAATGMTHTFSIKASNAVGDGPYSNKLSITPVCTLTPITLSATQDGANAKLSWNLSSGATSYTMLRFTGGAFDFAWAVTGSTSASLPWKTAGVSSGWQIQAKSFCQINSNTATFTPSAPAPSCTPSGSYSQSCTSCSTSTGQLCCQCKTAVGNYVSTCISLSPCCSPNYSNCNGQLKCGGC